VKRLKHLRHSARDADAGERKARERRAGERGLTLIELIVAFTILALLTTMAVPLAAYKVRRDKERELRWALHDITKAIDAYKDASTLGLIEVKIDTDGYPEKLEQLVDGVKLLKDANGKKLKLLRHIPLDPMTNSYDWGKHSTQDDPDSQSWGGQNIFSVYSKSYEKARDGTPYSKW